MTVESVSWSVIVTECASRAFHGETADFHRFPFRKDGAGYSRAVSDGDFCWVAGTTGYDYAAMTMPEAEDQTRNTMETIAAALAEAGLSLADVVRANYYITDAAYVDRVFPILGESISARSAPRRP